SCSYRYGIGSSPNKCIGHVIQLSSPEKSRKFQLCSSNEIDSLFRCGVEWLTLARRETVFAPIPNSTESLDVEPVRSSDDSCNGPRDKDLSSSIAFNKFVFPDAFRPIRADKSAFGQNVAFAHDLYFETTNCFIRTRMT